MNRFRMKCALDVDDLLLECIPYAIKLANEKYKYNPPITIHEVNKWGKLNNRADIIFEFFKDPKFFETQPVIKGAHEFVKKLAKKTDLYIITSIYPQYMGIRALRILKEFPEIKPENIFLTTSKELINVDILFDDGSHNILKSKVAYPILLRRPWNSSATGMLAVNNYDEFLNLVDVILKSYSKGDVGFKKPGLLVINGPTGSNKTQIAKEFIKAHPDFVKLKSYTTKPNINKDKDYIYVSKDEFIKMQDNNEFFESTMYGEYAFASKKEEVDKILNSGKNVLAIMDICGAMNLKYNYKNVYTVFIDKDKKELIHEILNKNMSNIDKTNRIISIDDEKNNKDICDYVIKSNDINIVMEELNKIVDK